MALTNEKQITHIWDEFAEAGFRYASDDDTGHKLGSMNEKRRDRMPVRREILQEFLDDGQDLATFSSHMGGEVASHKLWRFSGQMFSTSSFPRSTRRRTLKPGRIITPCSAV